MEAVMVWHNNDINQLHPCTAKTRLYLQDCVT